MPVQCDQKQECYFVYRVSVSRAIKPYGEPHRPSDWFQPRVCFVCVCVYVCACMHAKERVYCARMHVLEGEKEREQ